MTALVVYEVRRRPNSRWARVYALGATPNSFISKVDWQLGIKSGLSIRCST